MAFTAYTDQEVFNTPIINVVCNSMITALINQFSGKTIENFFALTGTPAKILQGAATTDVQNVPFITSDNDIFDYLKNNLSDVLPGIYDQFKRKTVIQFKYQSVFFEIHKADTSRTIVNVNGVFVQQSSEIPNNIL